MCKYKKDEKCTKKKIKMPKNSAKSCEENYTEKEDKTKRTLSFFFSCVTFFTTLGRIVTN